MPLLWSANKLLSECVNVHFLLLFCCKVVEPPELFHLSYVVDLPKVEVAPETPEPSETQLSEQSGGKSSLLKRASKTKQEAEEKQEAKEPEGGSKQETSTEKKDVERPPIFLTLQ